MLFAPQAYRMMDRIGDFVFFVYPESQGKYYQELIEESESPIRSDYRVYLNLDRNALAYVKGNCCFEQDTAARFFLHATPVDERNLSEGQRKRGTVGLDFDFSDVHGFQRNGQCLVARRLPDYAIQSIRIGQFRRVGGGFDNIWEAEATISPNLMAWLNGTSLPGTSGGAKNYNVTEHEGERRGQATDSGGRTL